MNSMNLSIAIESYLNYLNYFDFLALPCKAGNFTKFLLFDRVSAAELVNENVVEKLWKLDGISLRWRGGMINKVKQLHLPTPALEVTVTKRWNEFEWHAGNRSAAQEKAVCDGLNRLHFLARTWRHIGTERPESDTYTTDVISDDGVKVEVKGFNSPTFKH